ncbi:MAG: type II secretion system protein [Clostridiales bacterium]|nr:type II secretion system protein [Clostridiales bacterium]
MLKINKKKSTHASKLGFTLLEMVLVMAIMLICFTYLVSTFQIVSKSHTSVAMINDMHDFASMNLKAIANCLCNGTDFSSGDHTIAVGGSGDCVEYDNNNLLPSYNQYKGNQNGHRWRVEVTFTCHSSTKIVDVTINLYDTMEGGVRAFTDNMSVYCPSAVNMSDGSSTSISFSKEPVSI